MAEQQKKRSQPDASSETGATHKDVNRSPAAPQFATGDPAGSSADSGDGSSTAVGIYDQVKETATETYDAMAAKANTKIEERKGELSSGLKTVADTFRKTGTELKSAARGNPLTGLTAKYSTTAANKVDDLAGYFERKDLRAMMRDAEDFARRNPAVFLGAAFALGLAAARFLKSAPPDRYEAERPESSLTGGTVSPSGAERRPTGVPRTT